MDILPNILDPQDTSTGGGSASALAGAMAGALAAMVARLSSSGPHDPEGFMLCEHIFTRCEHLSRQLLAGSQEDARAFQSVRSAYQLPGNTDEEKVARLGAVQSAWQTATRAPLANARDCMEIYALSLELSGHANPKALSDLRCAMLLARAGFLGCLENVAINLPSLKNPIVAGHLAAQARELRDQFAGLEVENR